MLGNEEQSVENEKLSLCLLNYKKYEAKSVSGSALWSSCSVDSW